MEFLIDNEIDGKYISFLETSIEYCMKNILMLCQKKIVDYLKSSSLNKEVYDLMNRQDLYLNKLIMPSISIEKMFDLGYSNNLSS